MVIWLVAHGDFLFSDLPPQLAVHKADPSCRAWGLIPEDVPHVAEEPGGAGEQRRCVVHVAEEILGVLITLFRSLGEPVNGGVPVLGDVLPQQIQLAESILRVLIAMLR